MILGNLQALSGMDALPPVVMENAPADGVSVIALGKAPVQCLVPASDVPRVHSHIPSS